MPETAVAEVPSTSTPASPAPSSAPSAPSTAPATPATSAATPASRASEGLKPTSTRKEISDFLRKIDTPDPAAPSTPPVVPPAAAATVQTQDTPKPGEVVAKAEPPKEAWPTILENARTKAANELRTQYGITPQVTPEVFHKGVDLARAINENPIDFINKLAADIANHPVWGPQLRSSAGRTLASAPAARPEPDVQVVNAQGQVVSMTYSAERLAEVQKWDREQQAQEFKQLIQPLQQDRDARIQQEQVAQFQKEVSASADSELARVDQILDGRAKELGPKVAELMAQGVNHIDAALMVRKQFIVPSQTQAAEAAVLDKQLKKVAGNTVSGTGSITPKTKLHPGMSQKELAAALREMDAASA